MATRKNTFLLKRSNIAGKIPSPGDIKLGEVALNTADVILYTSGTTQNDIIPIGWDRIHRTGDTVTGDFNFYGDIVISGNNQPNGYALSVTGDTNLFGDVIVNDNLITNAFTANTIFTDYIDFNTAATVTTQFGRINWDSGTGTLNIGVGDSGTGLIDFQVGQEEVVRVYNGEATTLLKGEIVYVSGSQGNRPKVKRASAVSDGYSVTTLGMVDRNIASGSEGYVTTFGIISNLNTIGLTGGTPIWLSPTVPGGYTSVKPQAPQHTVLIGYVVRVSATVGSIFINISNGWELDELHDVRITSPITGDLLVRSSYLGTPVWINTKTLNGNYTISGNTNFLGDLNITGNTEQYGNVYISGTSLPNECALYVDGNVCIDGDFNVTGDTFMSGDFCMNNMNSGGLPTGTNCFDTTLIPTGSTIIHQFQPEGGVLAHLGDLATGEPNSRGYTYFENNITNTSFTTVGTGVFTPIIGAPQTFGPYNNLFIVTTGATTATLHKLVYNYPPATGSTTATYLKFTVSLTLQNAQNQALTFQVRRKRGVTFSFVPIGMSVTPQSNTIQGITFNGISDAWVNDEFQVVVKNDTGSGGSNSIRIVDMSFSMFT